MSALRMRTGRSIGIVAPGPDFAVLLRNAILPFLLFALAFVAAAGPAAAASNYAALVVDGNSGAVLFARNADAKRYPASLTKIMMLYVVFEELEAGRISMNTRFTVSKYASQQAPSKLGLRAGQSIAVKDAILALITKSANDVAVVVAEGISGSERAFADRMTRTARRIGMKSTTYRNPHGLPNSQQVTTARDLVVLSRNLMQRFPEYYKLFRTTSFAYGGHRYGNHNRLLGRFEGTEGIKTGYTRASGFNLVASVRRSNKLVIGVVLGGKSGRSRDAHMREIVTAAFPKAKPGRLPAYAKLPEDDETPMPTRKPVIARADTNSVDTADTGVVTASLGAPVALVAMPRSVTTIPIPVATRTIATLAETPAPAAAEPAIAEPAVASAAPVGGWVVQVGAFPEKDQALARIELAKYRATSVLASAAPFTEPVDKNGATLWRARFGGFDKASARAACDYLKRNDFACFAVPN